MADDWRKGDLALCVKRGKVWMHATGGYGGGGPAFGQLVTVRRVGFWAPDSMVVLWLEGWPGEVFADSFFCSRFRKIKPLTDEEREEALRELKEPVNG